MPAARQALLELFTDDLADSGFAFRNGRGGPRLARDIARAFQTVVDRPGFPNGGRPGDVPQPAPYRLVEAGESPEHPVGLRR
jgi:hypothetical protein